MKTLSQKFFSAPNYLSLPAAGIALSNHTLKYMEFQNTKGIVIIKTFGEVALLPDTCKDGAILNAENFTKALSAVKAKISADFVRISIPEEKTYIFDIQIPHMKKSADIRAALAFKLEENVPFKADEVFFEYEIVKSMGNNSDAKISADMLVSVSVIPKKIIADIADACASAGLRPLSFEIESRMTARALLLPYDARTSMIINIKDDSTVLSLVCAGTTRFSSTIAIGDAQLLGSLQKQLPSRIQSPAALSDAFSMEDTQNLLANIFSILKDGVDTFNAYVMTKSHDANMPLPATIDTVFLCGESASLPGLARHIGQHIDAEIVCGNVWTNVCDTNEYLPSLKFSDALGFATAIGLAIPNNL